MVESIHKYVQAYGDNNRYAYICYTHDTDTDTDTTYEGMRLDFGQGRARFSRSILGKFHGHLAEGLTTD